MACSLRPALTPSSPQGATRHGAARGGTVTPRNGSRWSVGRVGRVRARLTPRGGRETMSKSRIERMRIMRHHDPLPSNRTAVTQPVHPPPPRRQLFESQAIIAPAGRSAAFVFRIRVAARYLWLRLGPRSFTGRSNGPGSPAAESRRLFPSRCSKFLRCALQRTGRALPAQCPSRVLVASILRGPATPCPRGRTYPHLRFTASTQATLHDSETSSVAGKHPAGFAGAREVRAILKEPLLRAA